MIVFYVLVSILAFLVTYVLKSMQKGSNFPPGPAWYPIIGSLPVLKEYIKKTGFQHLAFEAIALKYKTKLLGMKLGQETIVVSSSYETIKDILSRNEFHARPNNFFIKMRCFGTIRGITCTEGTIWNEQRSFVMRHLRDVGFGKRPMEVKIGEELLQLVEEIEKQGPIMNVESLFSPSVMNVLWTLTASRTLSTDSRLNGFLKLMEKRAKAFDMAGGVLNVFPWLRFIAPERSGYNLLLSLNNDLHKFLIETIREHYEVDTENNNDDLIFAYINEMKKQENGKSNFTEEQLEMICLDLFIAGSQTTNTTLSFVFMYMLLYPEVMKKVQKEIDSVVPRDKYPQIEDKHKLPYCEAVLAEISRLKSPAPIIGPRRAMRDCVIDGYDVAKDTTILFNIWSVHMDKELWGDPLVFRPERFLNDKGEFVLNDKLLVFGLGKRRCPGEALARSCIFLFFTGLLQQFDITPVDKIPEKNMLPGITISPVPFKAKFVKRIV